MPVSKINRFNSILTLKYFLKLLIVNFARVALLAPLLIPNGRDCFAQSQFQLAIGDSSNTEEARSIIQTTDGGYVAVGETGFFGGDMYIVKLNSSGQLQWSRTIDGTGQNFAFSVVQTTDGGYAISGFGNYLAYIVKLTQEGSVNWTRVVTDEPWPAWSIVQTTDGGYAAAISPSEDGGPADRMMIVKLDSMGMPQWSKRIAGSSYARSIRQTTDKGYVVAGATWSFGAGDFDMFVVKLDSNGSLQWAKTIGGISEDFAYSIVQTTDGGYAVAGITLSFGNTEKMYIAKLDSSGMLQWTKALGAGGYRAYSIVQTTDGGYAVAGIIGMDGNMPIVKLNPDGSLQWNRVVDGSVATYARSIIQTTDGGYAAAGYGGILGAAGLFIVKLDNNGNTCGNSISPSITVETGGILGSATPTVTNITLSVTSPAITTGSHGSVTPICVIGIQPVSSEIPASYRLYQNYPNPFNPITIIRYDVPPLEGARGRNISLKIYDITGREVFSVNEFKQAGSYEVKFDGTNFASGLYLYKLETGTYADTKKMVLIK